ncbi:MAG TPA: alpha/beta fold hydrolase, partial [Longimicrobiaceae bacterium]|nr:alpha/beta fold hydrolase [Longimicrobiaceae bacterium]
GLEVFAFDVDGHGRGQRHDATRFVPGVVGSAVEAAVEESGALRRGLSLHGVGVSFGGSLLLHALPRIPFASAALLCAPLQVQLSARTALHEVSMPVLRTLWRERRLYGLTGLFPSFGPVRRGTYPLRLGVPVPSGAFGYVEVLNRTLRGLELEAAARDTRCPVLVVGGGRDRLVPADQAERIAELIPRGELLLLPGETHLSAVLAPEALKAVVRMMERTDAESEP